MPMMPLTRGSQPRHSYWPSKLRGTSQNITITSKMGQRQQRKCLTLTATLQILTARNGSAAPQLRINVLDKTLLILLQFYKHYFLSIKGSPGQAPSENERTEG
jgi:hypothetical protein